MRPSTMASRRRVCVVPRDSHEPRYPGAAVVVHVVVPPAGRRSPASTPRVNEPTPAKRTPNLLHHGSNRKPRLPFESLPSSTFPRSMETQLDKERSEEFIVHRISRPNEIII